MATGKVSLSGTLEWSIFTDVWMIFKNFYNVQPDNDAYWQALVNAADVIACKYANTPCKNMAEKLILSVVDELERRGQAYRRKRSV